MNRQVNLTKRVKTESGLRYCPVVLAANGRIRPNYVLVDGKQGNAPRGRVLSGMAEWASSRVEKVLSDHFPPTIADC